MSWAADALSAAGSTVLDLSGPLRAGALGALGDLAEPDVVEALDRLGRPAVRAGVAELVGAAPQEAAAATVARAVRRYAKIGDVLGGLIEANAADVKAAQAERDWDAVLGAVARHGATVARAALTLLVAAP